MSKIKYVKTLDAYPFLPLTMCPPIIALFSYLVTPSGHQEVELSTGWKIYVLWGFISGTIHRILLEER
jgi:hypothetical protein